MKRRLIELDGTTGEGGGQLVRNAIALASVVSQPVRIINVRGNRTGGRGGGLKAQHVSALQVLARATDADVVGLEVGSRTLEFRPRRGPGTDAVSTLLSSDPEGAGSRRLVRIVAGSPASSAMCIFQAVFPFLLFAGGKDCPSDADENGRSSEEPIELEIEGGTNVSWSPSFDYVDQVLCPALEAWFGVTVERRLVRRGWNSGPSGHGKVWFRFRPVKPGRVLGRLDHSAPLSTERMQNLTETDLAVKTIDITIVCPAAMSEKLTRALAKDLGSLFPDAELRFLPAEDSGHHSRMFVLLVARPAAGPLLWGRDLLFSPPSRNAGYERTKGGARGKGKGKCASAGEGGQKNSSTAYGGRDDNDEWMLSTSELLSRRVCRALHADVALRRGAVDEFLQDQLVIFQALRGGHSSFPRREALSDDGWDEAESGTSVTGRRPHGERDWDLRRLDLGEGGGGGGGGGLKRDKADAPFGEGSLHTTTARWVAAQLLPQVKWFNDGRVCEGAGVRMPSAGDA